MKAPATVSPPRKTVGSTRRKEKGKVMGEEESELIVGPHLYRARGGSVGFGIGDFVKHEGRFGIPLPKD